MANKVQTTKIGGKFDYALVPARLKEFLEEHPKAVHSTEETLHSDGSWVIRTTLVKDGSKPDIGVGQGSARYTVEQMKPAKSYEKLETISLGRALGNMGYFTDGNIASDIEMQEFNEWKDEKIELAVDSLMACNTIDELRETFMALGSLVSDEQVVNAKDVRKEQLQERTDNENS